MKQILLAVTVACMALPASVFGSTVGWDFTSAGATYTNGSWDFGDIFTVNTAISVTELGYYDDGHLGATSHAVGIFDMSGNLLIDATVNSGDCTDVGHFCYTGVASTALSAGTQYEIVGISGTEVYAFSLSGFATDPSITYDNSAPYKADDGSGNIANAFANPTFNGQFFGADFAFGDSPSAPEPGTFGVFLAGIAAIAVFFRRRQSLS